MLRAGEWDSQSRSEIYPHQDRHISKVIKHDHFVARTVENNIALIFLNEPFTLRENIGTICLPPQDYNFNGDKCYASGWGKDIFGKQKMDLYYYCKYHRLLVIDKFRGNKINVI